MAMNKGDDTGVLPVASNEEIMVLVRAAASGDEEAYARLYDRYHGRTKVVLQSVVTSSEAEDLNQEVWWTVFRKAGSFRGDAAFTTWLHRIAMNVALMYLRKPHVVHERLPEEPDWLPEQGVRGTPLSRWIPATDAFDLVDAISRLPRGYREMLVFHDIEGYEHHEIAEMLGVTEGTSKSQLHKARKRMRELLGCVSPVAMRRHPVRLRRGA